VAARHRDDLLAQGRKLGMQTVMAAFQILSDAKTQMFRSTFARTVLEMALVQLSLLENLSALSELLSGRLPAPAETMVSGEAGSEKKNSDDSPLIATQPLLPAGGTIAVSLQPLSSPDSDADSKTSRNLRPQIEPAANSAVAPTPVAATAATSFTHSGLTSEQVARLLPELTRCCGLTIAAGLKMVKEIQLVGSARLELLLEDTADFARRVLDLPDNRTRIEQEVLRVTGCTATVGLRLVRAERAPVTTAASESLRSADPEENTPSQTQKTSAPIPHAAIATETSGTATRGTAAAARRTAPVTAEPPARNLLGDVDPAQDAFVQQVVEAFGATVVKVTKAPASRAGAVVEQETTAV
ncbi:MAG: hypothetical protein ACKOEO_06845, partial [Planctomycetaceae bacterium]